MLKEPQIDENAPWKQRYRVPVTYGEVAHLAPTRGLAVSDISGVYQLYAWQVPTGDMSRLTSRPEGVRYGVISPDGTAVYYHDDQKGNEIGHVVRVPFEGGAPEDITPDLPLYEVYGISFNYTGSHLGLTTITADEGFRVYDVAVGAGTALEQRRELYRSNELTSAPAFSYDGEVAVVETADQPGTLRSSLRAIDVGSGEQIGRLSDGGDGSIELHGFGPLPGDMRVLGTSDRSGIKRPLLWNVSTGERVDIPLDELEGEVVGIDWSPDGQRILLYQTLRAVNQLYLYDLSAKVVKRLLHPHGNLRGGYFVPDGDIFAHIEDSTHPVQLVALDGATGELKRVVLAAGEVPACRPWKSVSFPSSDGESIQGWLALPDGEGPFPTILEMHGGPEAATTESFDPESQCWLDHGFAFLTINYRGSTTFGKEFQEKIRGHIGHWELEDMVAVRDWLVKQGIAYPDQIFLTGWSYGGYLTLFALGKRPDLWAGGMAGVAFGDYVIAYEDEAEMLKAYDRGLMGGTPQERLEEYKASSPITYVEQVKAPLLIIQGHNDTRCPPRSVQVYEARMKELGKPIEVFWFDAGHGSLEVAQRIDHQERMLRFAYQVLTKR